MRDNYHSILSQPALDYASLTHGAVGHTIDLRESDSCLFVWHVDDVQNADPEHYFRIGLWAGDVADMSDEAAVTSTTGLLGEDLILDSTAYSQHTAALGYVGGKRYIRLKVQELVIVGTANANMSAVVVLDHGALQPMNTGGLI